MLFLSCPAIQFLFVFCVISCYVASEVIGERNDSESDADCQSCKKPLESNYGLRFRLPFTDMDIQYERNLKILKESGQQQLFLLHGPEFYQLIVTRDQKRLALIGMLAGSIQDLNYTDAEVIAWRKYILLVLAFDEFLEVYQIAQTTIAQRIAASTSDAPQFKPIQKISLMGRFRKLFLCDPDDDNELAMIVAVDFTKFYGRLQVYNWVETYFDSIDEITIPPIHVVSFVGSKPKYIISGKLSKNKTILTVYKIITPTMHLQPTQTLIVPAQNVQAVSFNKKNYIVACVLAKCNFYKMIDGKFNVHLFSSELSFNKLVAGEHFLIGERKNEVFVYINSRFDCYGTLKSNATEVTSILTYVSLEGHDFILLNYVRPLTALIRVVEIEYESGGDALNVIAANNTELDEVESTLNQQRHLFEHTIDTLRSILLKRKVAMDVFRKASSPISLKNRKIVVHKSVQVHAGNIGIVHVIGKSLRSPAQILQRIKKLSSSDERRTRLSRAFQLRSDISNTTEVPRKIRAKTLHIHNLIYGGNLIDGFHLDLKAFPYAVLSVRPAVVTKVLRTEELFTPHSIRRDRQAPMRVLDFGPTTIKTRHLFVNRINGTLWAEFYDSLFLKNRDSAISGRLILQAEAKVGNLEALLLNGLTTHNIFNLIEEQNVTSKIIISAFFIRSLQVERINGLDFIRDIARRGVDNIIHSPVVIRRVSIAGNLTLAENDENMARHVFGTSFDDFEQTYTGKVLINGSLTVEHLSIEDSQNTTVSVAGQEFSVEDIRQNYMLRTQPQVFSQPVIFIDSIVKAPQLNTLQLNGQLPSHYLLTTVGPMDQYKPVFLIVMSAKILGNLLCEKDFPSKLRQLSTNVIRSGERADIYGIKSFQLPLKVDSLEVVSLNQLSVMDLLRKRDINKVNFSGIKTFSQVHVTKEATITGNLNVNFLNGIPLENDLLNFDYHYDTFVLKEKLNASNVIFNYLNSLPFEKLFTSLEISAHGDLTLHKDLYIDGSVNFGDSLTVNLLNDIAWNDYLSTLVGVNDNVIINGKKSFTKALTITTDLKLPLVNGVNVEEIFSNILLKSHVQVITGTYTFNNLHLKDVHVPIINNMTTASIIDTRLSDITIDGDLIVRTLKVNGSLLGKFTTHIDFSTLPSRFLAIPRKPWRNIIVLGNARWSNSAQSGGKSQQIDILQYLYAHAVRGLGDQVITGNVKFEKPFRSGKMSTTEVLYNGLDFEAIAGDCLFRQTIVQQVIRGAKKFAKPMEIGELEAMGFVGTPIVNQIAISQFNASIFRIDDASSAVIRGPLEFKVPPNFGHLAVYGTVNEITKDQLFYDITEPLPPIRLNELIVEDTLLLQDMNEMSLEFLLRNRIQKSGNAVEVFGYLTFENLILNKEIIMQSINGISIDSVVQKVSDGLQELTAPKVIKGNLILSGPAHVTRLNGQDIIERYHQSIFINQNYIFNSLSVESATFEGGLTVSGMPTNRLSDRSTQIGRLFDNLKGIEHQLRAIEQLAEARHMKRSPRLLYFDYDYNVTIEWRSINDSNDQSEKFLFDINRYLLCNRQQIQVQWSKYHNRFYLSKSAVSDVIFVEAFGLSVRAENYCETINRKIRSKISITGSIYFNVYTMKKLIVTVDVFNSGGKSLFVLVHAIDRSPRHNEIRILKIDNITSELQDWQIISDGIGKVARIFRLPKYSLLVSGGGATLNNKPLTSVYNYNHNRRIFELLQIIDGNFEIFEMVQTDQHKFYLMLSCLQCQQITIYEYDASTSHIIGHHRYRIFQIIKLRTPISKLIAFTLADGGHYMLVLSENGNNLYHVYRYGYIKGWVHTTYGYFPEIHMAFPLASCCLSSPTYAVDFRLLLCNTKNKCSVVKPFLQQ